MTLVYVLAHFDDEYCGLPLIDEARAAGQDQLFLYVVDYPSAAIREQRHAESRRFLKWLGVDPSRAVHLGEAAGAVDGGLHRALPTAYAALEAALRGVEAERFVCPAWEGGHMDHDMCALLARQLAAARGVPVEMISLYNGRGLPAPLFHGGRPLAENGPVRRFRLGAGGLVRWMLAVRFFILQRAWLGLWPTMFWTYWTRGFGVQRLSPARIRDRPHEGVLLYERMFKVPYAEVRAAADDFLARKR
ncbi:MAG: PIG-L deacetylase family protein [Phenylobacterium sp.]